MTRYLCKLLFTIVALLPALARGQAFSPETIREAYGFNLLSANYTTGTTGAGQTIAIIDAFGSSTLASDLNQFDSTYGLPGITPTVMSQTGSTTNLPTQNDATWARETTQDVEYAHAIAPGAAINVIEASSAHLSDLFTAANYAANNGASVVSMSFHASESTSLGTTFNQPGVTFVAASGDTGSGTGVNSPASSPYVVAVGGTSLTAVGSTYGSETAWAESGGGVSKVEAEPSYQLGVQQSTFRTVPDVAYDADINTGMDIVFGGVTRVAGGTSMGAPQWAGLFALADQQRAANQLPLLSSFDALQAMYALYGTSAYSTAFHDITSGSNGTYSASTGYDEVTGLGSPIANDLVPYLGSIPLPEPARTAMLFILFPLLMQRHRQQHLHAIAITSATQTAVV